MSLKKRFRELLLGAPPVIDRDTFGLSDAEKWWRDRYTFLESRGYRLRERLKPGWVPSWKTNLQLRPEDCEDSVFGYYPHISYATRIADDSFVVIKRLAKGSNEKFIATFLSSGEDEKNHCVPIIDSFPDDSDAGIEFIVMPLLRNFNSPPFFTVKEVIDFVRQTLEGIIFIHSMDVAHRDCSDLNIMLDGESLCPDGFHPIVQNTARSWTRMARFQRRSDTPGIKYYFTDFGLSTRFDDSVKDRLVTGRRCQVDVPELSDSVPYDPFAVDIYILGDVYRRHFIEKYSNVQFLSPLVERMVQRDPAQRPNADESLKALDRLASEIPGYRLRWRLIDIKVGPVSRAAINVKCFGREGIHVARQFIGGCRAIVSRTADRDACQGTQFNCSGLKRQ